MSLSEGFKRSARRGGSRTAPTFPRVGLGLGANPPLAKQALHSKYLLNLMTLTDYCLLISAFWLLITVY